MATNDLFDRAVSQWLEESAPTRIPDRVLDSTFERTRTSGQQQRWRAFLGSLNMPRFVSALGTAAIVVVAAALALNFFANQQSGIGGPLPTGRGRSIDEVIRVTAPMHRGFAGGLLADTAGRALGMTTAADIRFCTAMRLTWLNPYSSIRAEVITWWQKDARAQGAAGGQLYANCGAGADAQPIVDDAQVGGRLHSVYASTVLRWNGDAN